MSRERKILLIILSFSILLSISIMNFFFLNEKHNLLRNRIKIVEQNLNKMERKKRIVSIEEINFYKNEIEKEKARYFDAVDTDPFQFAIEIKSLLENENITVNSYKTIEDGDSLFIEFTVEGQSVSLFRILEKLNNKNMNYLYPLFSVKNLNEGISSIFRIGYMTDE